MPGGERHDRRSGGLLARGAIGWALLAAPWALAASASGPAPVPAPAPRTLQHAILISIDSLRADHLPMYGYPRRTTPFLASLVADGRAQVFVRSTAVAPSCNPSHSTMLTGRYPQQVGVPFCGEDLIFKPADAQRDEDVQELMDYQALLRASPEPLVRKKLSTVTSWLKIPEGTRTLATFLDERGFLTGGFVSIWTIERRFGYARGFDRFEDEMSEYYGPPALKWLLGHALRSQRRQPAQATLERLLEFLDDRQPDERLFAFVNLADTHVPYHAPPEVRFDDETERDRQVLEEAWRRRYPEDSYRRAMKKMGQGGELLLDSYDRSIKWADSLIERLFRRLEALDLLRDTLVVITSDHGDSHGQHRYMGAAGPNRLFFEHSVYVWEETQHVPLIVYDPRVRSAAERRANVSQVDLVPTVLEALGQDAEAFGGSPLPGRALGDLPDEARRVYFLTFGRGYPGILKDRALDYPGYVGFREGDLKFFVNKRRFRDASAGRCFLYDLSVDPDELHNLCEQEESRARAARYRGELLEWYNDTVAQRRTLSKTGPAARR